jgi:hypothetical protein
MSCYAKEEGLIQVKHPAFNQFRYVHVWEIQSETLGLFGLYVRQSLSFERYTCGEKGPQITRTF